MWKSRNFKELDRLASIANEDKLYEQSQDHFKYNDHYTAVTSHSFIIHGKKKPSYAYTEYSHSKALIEYKKWPFLTA
jgi:hypothetical protein